MSITEATSSSIGYCKHSSIVLSNIIYRKRDKFQNCSTALFFSEDQRHIGGGGGHENVVEDAHDHAEISLADFHVSKHSGGPRVCGRLLAAGKPFGFLAGETNWSRETRTSRISVATVPNNPQKRDV